LNTNQSPDFAGFNAYGADPLLQMVARTLPVPAQESFAKLGQWAGNIETIKLGALANNNPPELHSYNARGDRLDRVDFHPAWHALMRKSVENGLSNSIWVENENEKGNANLARAVRFYMTSGVELGHLCPITMTNASVPAINASPEVLSAWLPKIQSLRYDPGHKPKDQKHGVIIGMGLTEREGGSDVRSNKTQAQRLENGLWQINGQKWFMSAPMCDAFLVLAQMPEGMGCFLLPRILDDGSANGLQLQRLKNKLGNRSNASSEVIFNNSLGFLLGEPGNGIKTIMEMVTLTRLDCALGSAGLMRISLAEAVHHCRHRSAFDKKLVEQPLMQRVLADLALDVTAASALSFRLARAFDKAPENPAEAAYARLMTPVIKYWVCKLAPSLIYEAMECLGGNGYMETFNMARHYREAPLNAIWEGSGNIMCLDVMRVLSSSTEIADTVLYDLERDMGTQNADKTIAVIRSATQMAADDLGSARILVEQLAYTAAAAELNRLGAGDTAGAFMETRLGGLWRSTYGMLDNRYNAAGIIDENYPAWA